jgi:pyridoxal phosphate enzyme (YggS family)
MSAPENTFDLVRIRIRAAAEAAGRDPSGVRLVAVSKTHPPEAIREAAALGQTVFGESKIQEAMAKIPLLPPSLEWHFIGHLQSNKIRKALPLFRLFHGVDNSDLAARMDRASEECGGFPRILLEVNVSGEESKFGFQPDRLRAEIAGLLALPRVEVLGLMTMAPYSDDPLAARPYFAALRRLRDDLEQQTGAPLPELSMGMSGDFEAAIAEGSTLVRIGSALFGERPKNRPDGFS